MADKNRTDGLSRRDFFKTVGLGGAAATATALGAGGSMVFAEDQGGNKAAGIPLRKLGSTGLEVSSLCLGGMFDTINNQLLLKQALNWGVNYWDTAELYGNGMSEEGYGRYFGRNPDTRKKLVVATKIRPEASAAAMVEKTDKALKRLNTDYIDIFYMHGIDNISEMSDPVREWAEKVKTAGKVKHVGFTTHSNMDILLTAASKLDWVEVVMFSYNFRLMHEQSMKDAMDACVKKGIGLVAMKSQGGGPVKTDSEAELKVAGRFLEKGFTDKQARMKAIWENPQIASICSQMPTLTILSANVAAARDMTALAGADVELLKELAMETRTGYCAGCSRICSEAVNGAVPVSDVMRCLMYYRDYGDRDVARSVFSGLAQDMGDRLAVVDFSEADRVCPQGLKISALMREAKELFC